MNHKNFLCKFFLLLAVVCSFTTANAKGGDEPLQYTIKSCDNVADGYWMVEVTTTVSKKKNVNEDILQKCAVHGALFKGIAKGTKGNAQIPICGSLSAETQHADYFNAFFQQDYRVYADVITESLTTVKTDDGFQLTATVQIAKDSLRKAMEEAGIIRQLGF